MKQSNSAQAVLKGYEVLGEQLLEELLAQDLPTIRYEGVTDKAMRTALHKGNSERDLILLRAPYLLTTGPRGPAFIATQTSFTTDESHVAQRVISTDMVLALKALDRAGHVVYVAHRPYGGGRWRTAQELMWSINAATEPLIAPVGQLQFHSITPPSGWRLTSVMQGPWIKWSEWLAQRTSRG